MHHAIGTLASWVLKLPANSLILLVWCYQRTISRLYGPVCRFHPTCSAYFIGAVKKHGAIRGTIKGIWRICRCNPFNRGGFDPP